MNMMTMVTRMRTMVMSIDYDDCNNYDDGYEYDDDGDEYDGNNFDNGP